MDRKRKGTNNRSTGGGKSVKSRTLRRKKGKSILGATLSRAKKKLGRTRSKRSVHSSAKSKSLEDSASVFKSRKFSKYDGDRAVDEQNLEAEKKIENLLKAKNGRRREIFETTLEIDDAMSKGSRGSLKSVKTFRTIEENSQKSGNIRNQRASNSFSMSSFKITGLGRTLKKKKQRNSGEKKRFRNLSLPFVPKAEVFKDLIRESLSQNIFFSALPESEIEKLVSAMDSREVAKGDFAAKEGEEEDEFFVVKSGTFRIGKEGGEGEERTEGESFGELALVLEGRREFSAEAVEEDCEVFFLSRLNYRKVMAFSEEDRLRSIRNVLLSVPLLQSLSRAQIADLADCVHLVKFNAGDVIIVKGDEGNICYFIKSGKVECTKVGKELKDIVFGPGEYFGERALLVDEPRAANVVALEEVECLALDREAFSKHLGSLRDIMNKNLTLRALKAIPLLHDLSDKQLSKLCASMEEREFLPGEQIIDQGAKNKHLFIITEGEVQVTMFDQSDRQKHTDLGTLKEGDFFGEGSIKSKSATAEVTAVGNVTCQVIEVKKNQKQLRPIAGTLRKKKTQRHKSALESMMKNTTEIHFPQQILLEDLDHVRTLGTGTFGRVKLVEHTPSSQIFALKILQKSFVIKYKQQKNVMNEKHVMMKSQHPFILKLERTFVTKNCLYFLLEYIQGGELFSLLHLQGGNLKPSWAKFYAACVVDALGYLHKRQIVYRDLKPENLMIDSQGFIRVVDFGFAKKVLTKTYTLCGTPEYLPPETITKRGHNRAVDYWAVGVLIYEMIAGFSPFSDVDANEQDQIFERILKGRFLFPYKGFPSKAKNLVTQLMEVNPIERLGMFKEGPDEIKDHVWFSDVDFQELRDKAAKAPWIPKIRDKLDTQFFDDFDEDDDEIPYKGSNKYWQTF